MKKFAIVTAMIFSGAAISAATPVSAADFLFNYNGAGGSGITGSGMITTGASDPSGSFFSPSLLVTSINGVFNGSPIQSLLPAGTFYQTSGIFGSPGNDNILYYPSSQVYMGQTTIIDRYGLAFDTGTQRVNLFFGLGGYGSIIQNLGESSVSSDVGGTFSISPATTGAVPEPAAWAMLLMGFGGIGLAIRRRAKVRMTVCYA